MTHDAPTQRRGGLSTLADVARLAGVSTSTASLAFRHTGSITDRTRARILAAAAELGYAGPDPVARSLKNGRSGIVGVVVAEQVRFAFRNPVTIATMDGLSEVLDELGCGQLLLPGRADARARIPAPSISSMPLDAVVFATRGEEFDSLLPALRARHTPMVGIEGPHADDVALVEIDDFAAMSAVAGHLEQLGHTHVAVVMRTTHLDGEGEPGPIERITANLDRIANRTINARLSAVAALWPDAVRVEAGGRMAAAGEAAAQRLLASHPRPTAILAQNDQLAAGVLRAAAKAGLDVPGDLSVTGFDGAELPWIDRDLTTAVQPLRERGRAAGRMVGRLLAGEPVENVLLPVTLHVGDTTAPPPAG